MPLFVQPQSFMVFRVAFAAAAAGTPDDVTIFNADCPFAIRILDSEVLISTAIALTTVQLRDATGGGGAALSDAFSSAVAGRIRDGATGIGNVTPTVAEGGTIVLRRSDRGVAGEVIILAKRE